MPAGEEPVIDGSAPEEGAADRSEVADDEQDHRAPRHAGPGPPPSGGEGEASGACLGKAGGDMDGGVGEPETGAADGGVGGDLEPAEGYPEAGSEMPGPAPGEKEGDGEAEGDGGEEGDERPVDVEESARRARVGHRSRVERAGDRCPREVGAEEQPESHGDRAMAWEAIGIAGEEDGRARGGPEADAAGEGIDVHPGLAPLDQPPCGGSVGM